MTASRHGIALAAAAVLFLGCGNQGQPVASKSPTPTTTPSPAPTPAPTPTSTPLSQGVEAAALFEGTYTGTWNNTTFGSTGPIRTVIKVDRAAATVSVTSTIGGQVFGGAAPAPETYTAPIPSGGPPYTLNVKSAWLGDVALSMALQGAAARVTMSAPAVPNARVGKFEATGTATTPASIAGDYTVTFKDGTKAAGTWTVTRQP